MNKKEREEKRIKESMHLENRRGGTFVGCRPSTMESKKYNIKSIRQQGKKECEQFD